MDSAGLHPGTSVSQSESVPHQPCPRQDKSNSLPIAGGPASNVILWGMPQRDLSGGIFLLARRSSSPDSDENTLVQHHVMKDDV